MALDIRTRPWLRTLFLSVAAGAAILLAWSLAPLVVNKLAFRYAESEIVNRSQLSHLLVRGVLLIVMLPFFWSVAELLRLPRLWGRQSRHVHRRAAKATLVLCVATFSLILFGVSRDKYFTREGAAQKWCAETPEGARCYDQPGHDPVYGLLLEPATSEDVIAWKRKELGDLPQKIALDSVGDYEFFDPLTKSRPRAWYGTGHGGDLELFDRPGFHPATGQPLQPITSEVIHRYEVQLRTREAKVQAAQAATERLRLEAAKREQNRLEEARRAAEVRRAEEQLAADDRKAKERIARYISAAGIRRAPQVLVVDQNGSIDATMSQAIATELRGHTDLFKPAFVADGLFAAAVSGDSAPLLSLGLNENSGSILLVRRSTTITPSNFPTKGLHKAETTMTGRRYFPERRFASVVVSSTGKSAAFSPSEAKRRSEQDALSRMLQRELN